MAVETALVMPLFVFLLLGLLQLGLMHQARLMTKYAAYKAARAGSLGSAGWVEMNTAALAVLMPMASSGAAGSERVFSSYDLDHWAGSWDRIKDNRQDGVIPYVAVMTCGPTLPMVLSIPGVNPTRGVDFDDPRAFGGGSWAEANVTRLHVQVTFFYRLMIPFVNGILWRLALGTADEGTMQALRMSETGVVQGVAANGSQRTIDRTTLQARAAAHEYILPIRASWGMRMQSKLFPYLSGFELPERNDCRVPWRKAGGT